MTTPLLILLPLSWFGACLVWQARRTGSLREAFLLSSVLWGTVVALLSEVLSLGRALAPLPVAAGWLVVGVPIAVLLARRRSTQAFPTQAREAWLSLPHIDRILIGLLGAICGALFVIAVASPPNNVDSFLYHMARVMHWQQNRGLQPYPVLIEHQLNKPIWAETAILHLRMLWGSDRPAALVQWFSMVGSLIAVSAAAELLGASRRAQILAAWLCVSIPMGILQASSTQNDYVAAYWSAVVAYLVVLAQTRSLDQTESLCLGLVTGLGALTKGTFFVYAPPLLAYYAIGLVRTRAIGRLARSVVVMGIVIVALNSGFWARNIIVFGGPYGTSEWLMKNLGLSWIVAPLPGASATAVPASSGVAELAEAGRPEEQAPSATGMPASAIASEPTRASQPEEQAGSPECVDCLLGSGVLSRAQDYLRLVAWTAGRNLTFPFGWLQSRVVALLARWDGVFGPGYAAEVAGAAWNHEDSAGNPLHLALVPTGLGLALLRWKMPKRRMVLAYMLTVLVTFMLLPVVIGHGASIWGIRYQLPFFVLWAPSAAAAVVGPRAEGWAAVGALVLAVHSLPWVTLNNTRPLIGMPPWPTRTRSILVEDPVRVLLATNPGLVDDYQLTALAIRQAGCTQVGLNARSNFLEYPLWWLLDAPQNGTRIEVLTSDERLQPYVDHSFSPCAVVCPRCEGQDSYGELPLAHRFDTMRVYVAP